MNHLHRLPAAALPTIREVPLTLAHGARRPQPLVVGTRAAGVILDRVALPIEAELIAVLVAPLRTDVTTRAGFDRKEQACATLLAQLGCEQARALGRRLDLARADDALAVAFGRLTADRRGRLRVFVADTPRRLARDNAQRAA